MLDTFDAIQEALIELDQQISGATTQHSAPTAGLDGRCGPIYVGEDYIATRTERALNYYGGFEYIDNEYIQRVGSWTIYSIEADRVQGVMDALEHNLD